MGRLHVRAAKFLSIEIGCTFGVADIQFVTFYIDIIPSQLTSLVDFNFYRNGHRPKIFSFLLSRVLARFASDKYFVNTLGATVSRERFLFTYGKRFFIDICISPVF